LLPAVSPIQRHPLSGPPALSGRSIVEDRWVHIAAGAVPYVASAAIWSAYILQSQELRRAIWQQRAHANSGITSPWTLIKGETLRYECLWARIAGDGLSRIKVVMLLALRWDGKSCRSELRRQPSSRILLSAAGLVFILMLCRGNAGLVSRSYHSVLLYRAGVWSHAAGRRVAGRSWSASPGLSR
jgi:hypothetical protein